MPFGTRSTTLVLDDGPTTRGETTVESRSAQSLVFGRDAELARVERFLDAIAVEPAALVVEGAPGIGKTTVWAAAIAAAASRGTRVLQARAAETEVQLSYAALADLVGTEFEEIRRALPPVQQRALAAALLRTDADEPAQPRTIATAFVSVLASMAETGVVLVAVDDVQWLDPASAGVLAFAARRLPARVGLLLTRRGEPSELLPLGLERALPEARLERLVPRPLSLAALHHLLRDRLGSAPPRPALARLTEASGGNPFLALEIARALAPDWSALAGGGPLPVPRDLELIVRERVDALSAGARSAALVAAALSRPTQALIVEAIASDRDGDDLLAAEDAGVLVIDADRVRFSHPLLGSAIYGSASPERRRRLHERLAEVVTDPEERAHHLALSTTSPDEAVAAELEHAAMRAAKRGAQQAASELFGGSRRLTPDDRTEERSRRELAHAAALLAQGDLEGGRDLAERVAANAPAGPLRARALLLLGDIAWIEGRPAAIEQLELAVDAADGDPDLLALIYPKLVYVSLATDPASTIGRARSAVRALDPERDPAALASLYFDWAWAETIRGNGEQPDLLERWRVCDERAGPDAPKSLLALIYFHCVDDFEAARARYAVEERWYRERGEDVWRAERLGHIALAELRAGRWDISERSAEEACETIAQLETPGPWTMAFRSRSIVDAHRGRVERARKTLQPLAAHAERAGRVWWETLLRSALAFVEFVDGNHAEADRMLTRMRRLMDSLGVRDFLPDRSEPFHIESLVALGEVDRARDVLARLEERGRTFPRLWITVGLPRARALVLAAEGDVTGALGALDELDADAASQLPFALARAQLVRGRLQRRAKQKRAAADTLREALQMFERLGAPAFEAQARMELDRVGLRRAPDELTATERRVAELAADGLTNREVASKAFMSPKTVQANLTRVYRKLGISSRAELGARMADERRRVTAQK